MLHSVHDLNPTRLNQMTSTLQRMQDDPEVLDRSRRRFDADDPPPLYSTATITDPPTATFFTQRPEHEISELVRPALNNEELYWFRTSLYAYHAGHRFEEESDQEEQRIRDEWSKRDEYYRPLYHGPDLIGSPGTQRLDIMVRNSIRKRWEQLGVWNTAWGIPGRVNKGAYDNPNEWIWKWEKPRQVPATFEPTPHEEEVATWPTRDEEGPNARAIRQLLESKSQWGDRYGPALAEGNQDTEIDIDPHESLITSRPWFRWKLEVEEEARRLARARRFTLPDYETAKENARARWQVQGDWKDTWRSTPGWKWRHESPSPELEDPNDMDFSSSEVDALGAIPLQTPPPSLPIKSAPVNNIRDLFSAPLKPGSAAAAQQAEDAKINTGSQVDGIGDDLNGDAQTNPSDGEPFPTDEQPEAASAATQGRSQKHSQNQVKRPSSGLSTTRKLRKRKRNGKGQAYNDSEPSSTELSSPATPRQAKRPRTAPAVHRVSPQADQRLVFNATSTCKPAPVEHIRRNPDRSVADSVGALRDPEALPGPRRSSRIRAWRGTSKNTMYDERVEQNSVNDGNAHKKPSRPKKRAKSKVLSNGLIPQSIINFRTGQQSWQPSRRRNGGAGVKA